VLGVILRAAELAGVLLMVGAGGAALTGDPTFLGDWPRRDRVEPCGGAFCGLITWVRSGVSGEKVGATGSPSTSGQPALCAGSGDAFDPQRNQTYTIKIHVAHKRMTTYGCVMSGLMCERMRWTRLGPSK